MLNLWVVSRNKYDSKFFEQTPEFKGLNYGFLGGQPIISVYPSPEYKQGRANSTAHISGWPALDRIQAYFLHVAIFCTWQSRPLKINYFLCGRQLARL